MDSTSLQRRIGAAIGVCALLALAAMALWWLTPAAWREWIFGLLSSTEGMRAAIARAGVWAPLISVGLMVLHSLVPFPAEMVAIANGMIFGLPLGVAATWSGAMLGALLAYGLARALGQDAVRRLAGAERWAKIDKAKAGFGPQALLLARLTPVVSFNLVNYAAGLAGVNIWTFLWTTAVGILPITIASVLVGSHMVSAPWPLWVGLFALVLAGMVLHWRWARKKRPFADEE